MLYFKISRFFFGDFGCAHGVRASTGELNMLRRLSGSSSSILSLKMASNNKQLVASYLLKNFTTFLFSELSPSSFSCNHYQQRYPRGNFQFCFQQQCFGHRYRRRDFGGYSDNYLDHSSLSISEHHFYNSDVLRPPSEYPRIQSKLQYISQQLC